MSIPNKINLSTLDYVYQGQPFVFVEAKSLNTSTLDTVYQAQPFVGATLDVWVNINGTWKNPSNMYVNVNGEWKSISSLNVNVSGSWK